MNIKKKELVTAIFLFFCLESITVFSFFDEYRKEKFDHFKIHLDNLKSQYDGAFIGYENVTRIIFNDIINKPLILGKFALANANKNLRDKYRNEIYQILKTDYESQKEIGLRQLHFHCKDGTSFLRMHAPEKYGDYLFDKRYSLQIANSQKRHVSGFEEGHFADGFRYVYPLFYLGEHAGSVEMAITAGGIIDHIMKIDPAIYYFVIKKEKVMSVTYTDWRRAHYKLSDFSENFVTDKSFKEFDEAVKINGKIRTKISDEINAFKPFAKSAGLNGVNYLVFFQPIKNFKGENVAYLIQYVRDNFLRNKIGELIRNIILSTTLILLIFFSYWKIRTQHRELAILNKNLEERVLQRTNELETAIKELEDFNYSVSHDLRAPLRAMNGFSQILLSDYAGKLDVEGRRLLNVVVKNTAKMGRLIDDILFFSHLRRAEIKKETVDMERLVKNVWKKLISPLSERKVQLDIKTLEPAFGDYQLLRQVMINLLSNALKFTSQKETARIEVGSHEKNGEYAYYVKDNGCGFDMSYAGKLFGLFSRLHGMEEYEGTGIGLAVVKRIVLKHGGKVHAEGKLNEGASFYFSLPKP